MSQQRQQQLQYQVVGIVWEGEWPVVKEVARTCRRVSQCAYGFLHDALYFPGAKTAMNNGLAQVDNGVHQSSLWMAKYLNQTSPWLPAASCVVAASLVATVKSNHYWGPVAGARNGFVTLAAASLFFFPNEIRAAAFPGETPEQKKE